MLVKQGATQEATSKFNGQLLEDELVLILNGIDPKTPVEAAIVVLQAAHGFLQSLRAHLREIVDDRFMLNFDSVLNMLNMDPEQNENDRKSQRSALDLVSKVVQECDSQAGLPVLFAAVKSFPAITATVEQHLEVQTAANSTTELFKRVHKITSIILSSDNVGSDAVADMETTLIEYLLKSIEDAKDKKHVISKDFLTVVDSMVTMFDKCSEEVSTIMVRFVESTAKAKDSDEMDTLSMAATASVEPHQSRMRACKIHDLQLYPNAEIKKLAHCELLVARIMPMKTDFKDITEVLTVIPKITSFAKLVGNTPDLSALMRNFTDCMTTLQGLKKKSYAKVVESLETLRSAADVAGKASSIYADARNTALKSCIACFVSTIREGAWNAQEIEARKTDAVSQSHRLKQLAAFSTGEEAAAQLSDVQFIEHTVNGIPNGDLHEIIFHNKPNSKTIDALMQANYAQWISHVEAVCNSEGLKRMQNVFGTIDGGGYAEMVDAFHGTIVECYDKAACSCRLSRCRFVHLVEARSIILRIHGTLDSVQAKASAGTGN